MSKLRVHYGHANAPVSCGNQSAQESSLDREEVTCSACRKSPQFKADFFNNVDKSLLELDVIVSKQRRKVKRS